MQVNGHKITGPHTLKTGDVITLGKLPSNRLSCGSLLTMRSNVSSGAKLYWVSCPLQLFKTETSALVQLLQEVVFFQHVGVRKQCKAI
jgi:hypothetical protein